MDTRKTPMQAPPLSPLKSHHHSPSLQKHDLLQQQLYQQQLYQHHFNAANLDRQYVLNGSTAKEAVNQHFKESLQLLMAQKVTIPSFDSFFIVCFKYKNKRCWLKNGCFFFHCGSLMPHQHIVFSIIPKLRRLV